MSQNKISVLFLLPCVSDFDRACHLCQRDQLWLPRPSWKTHHRSGPQRHPRYSRPLPTWSLTDSSFSQLMFVLTVSLNFPPPITFDIYTTTITALQLQLVQLLLLLLRFLLLLLLLQYHYDFNHTRPSSTTVLLMLLLLFLLIQYTTASEAWSYYYYYNNYYCHR